MSIPKCYGTFFSALFLAQGALAQTKMDVIGVGGAKIIGGSVKLTPVNGSGAFYLVNDDDGDGSVVLTDWDGQPLKNGLYTVEVRGNSGNFVRATEIKLTDNRVVEMRNGAEVSVETTASPNVKTDDGVNPVVLGGAVAAAVIVGLAASSGNDSGNGGGNSGGGEVPEPGDDTDTHQSGQIDCQVSRDDNGHAATVGEVGGSSDLRITSGSMQLNMPISGAIAYFTGTYGAVEFRVSEFATIGDYSNTELIASGNFYPANGAIDFNLVIGANGSFGDSEGQIGIDYVCSGNLTPNN